MHKKYLHNQLPEIVFAGSNASESKLIHKWKRAGLIRSILPKVYSSNLDGNDEVIIKRNLWIILSYKFPNAILSHRSALEFKLSPKNHIYLTGNTKRVFDWAGIKIKMQKGPKPLESDKVVYENLIMSSFERALLENLSSSRTTDGEKRVLAQNLIEERLIQELEVRGEDGINQIRDKARLIAEKLNWNNQFQKLNKLISAILSSNSINHLKSSLAKAVSIGEPYDAGRMELFQTLIAELKSKAIVEKLEKTQSNLAFNSIAFFESYFSNYIEGTTFEVDEAKSIIYDNQIIPNRIGDTHDIKATFEVVSNRFEMNQIPISVESFTSLLQSRHKQILRGRIEKNPGFFKTITNRAGNTIFVSPNKVKGTLKEGFKLIGSLTKAYERALYMMFLVSEVHPFDDGNGRIARVMMNAELVHAKESKIIIPTVYRDDYMLNLKKFSNKGNPKGYINMMDRTYEFSHWLNAENFDNLEQQLHKSNSFKESSDAVLTF